MEFFFNHALHTNKGLSSVVVNDCDTWGVSITNHDPESKDWIGTSDSKEAFKLQQLLTKLTPISTDSPISFVPSNKI